MKNIVLNKILIIGIALSLVSLITMSCEKNETSDLSGSRDNLKSAILEDEADTCKMISNFPYEEVDQEEISDLLFMREEEKLARDVYQEFYNLYAIPIFKNISKSEQQHTNAVLSILTKYNLDDPVTDDTRGVFKNSDLKKMFDNLIELGNSDVIEALKAGALIEETDINDLEEAIEKTNNEDISTIYINLRNASYRHLRAFVAQLNFRGISYEPVLLDTEVYTEIIGE